MSNKVKETIKMRNAQIQGKHLVGFVDEHPKLKITYYNNMITTSEIVHQEGNIFQTKNSTYEVVNWVRDSILEAK